MKKFSEDVKNLFVTTETCRNDIATHPSEEAQRLVYTGLIDKVAESNAVMFNAGVEAGVKMMMLRNFEKLAAAGLGNPLDTLMIGLLCKMPLSKGAEKGESVLDKAGFKFDGEPCKTDTGKPACCEPSQPEFNYNTPYHAREGRPVVRRDTVCGEMRATVIEIVR